MRAQRVVKRAGLIHELVKKYQHLPVVQWILDWLARKKLVKGLGSDGFGFIAKQIKPKQAPATSKPSAWAPAATALTSPNLGPLNMVTRIAAKAYDVAKPVVDTLKRGWDFKQKNGIGTKELFQLGGAVMKKYDTPQQRMDAIDSAMPQDLVRALRTKKINDWADSGIAADSV